MAGSVSTMALAEENHVEITTSPLLKAQHPVELTVTEKDTVDIVARTFLVNPWRWSEAWGQALSPEQLIPGDKVSVKSENGASFLVYTPAKRSADHVVTVKLSPEIIAIPYADVPVGSSTVSHRAALPFEKVAVFISHDRIFEDQGYLASLPRIIANQEGRLFGFPGSALYAEMHSVLEPESVLNVYRKGMAYLNPETNKLLGLGGHYVGQVRVGSRDKEWVRLNVIKARREMRVGDVLMPVKASVNSDEFTLSAATSDSQIIAPIKPIDLSGQYASVVINGGQQQGRQRGQIFSVYNPPVLLEEGNETVAFESEKPVGQLLVYKVFKQLSYAIVMKSSEPVESGDILKPASL